MTVSSMHLQLFLPLAPGCVSGRYEAAEDFLADVDLICRNALEYNPDTTEVGREIRHRACMLRDQVRPASTPASWCRPYRAAPFHQALAIAVTSSQ